MSNSEQTTKAKLTPETPKLTLEQAKFKQSLGLNEWQPLPEGVEYPENIR